MSFNNFRKDNLDTYLKELAKEFRRLNGRAMPAELILVGGAAVLSNYGFREMTADVDAVIHAASSMKDAINHVGDRFHLPNGWLNSDFMRTVSYSPKLNEFSVYYKTFYRILTVRTVSAEYLIAMKLCSGRKYKNDFSHVIGILAEHKRCGNLITLDKINHAVINLYGGWQGFPEYSLQFIKDALDADDFDKIYTSIRNSETESRNLLLRFEKDYPDATKSADLNIVLDVLKTKRNK